MTKAQLEKFIQYLQKKEYSIFGPIKKGKLIKIEKILNPKKLDLSGILPFYSFKKYFFPSCQSLFRYKNNFLKEEKETKKQAIFGMSIFDLKAILLYNHLFEKDPYYQQQMQNSLIIGQTKIPSRGQTFLIWKEKYEENILEHLQFDIFLGKKEISRLEFKIFTGSKRGQIILDDFGYKNYEHIQFAGPIREEGIDPEMLKIKELLPKTFNKKIWRELGKICLECGKCSLVCPTCFCFDIIDQSLIELFCLQGKRKRIWTSCFYRDFSRIAGDFRFLKETSQKIYNWYYHKFVRIPEEYGFPGCVGCNRCSQVCPVGIEINKVLLRIKKEITNKS